MVFVAGRCDLCYSEHVGAEHSPTSELEEAVSTIAFRYFGYIAPSERSALGWSVQWCLWRGRCDLCYSEHVGAEHSPTSELEEAVSTIAFRYFGYIAPSERSALG